MTVYEKQHEVFVNRNYHYSGVTILEANAHTTYGYGI